MTTAGAQCAVIFDMDGVILDSEAMWEAVMRRLFAECGVPYSQFDPDAFVGGDNSQQWASYLRGVCGLPLSEEEILDRVIGQLIRRYDEALPLIPGAVEAVERVAEEYPLGLASSSPREIIAFVLERSGLDRFFVAWTSSDDVACGKPAPDVYLRACDLMGADPSCCIAVEDSPSGIRAAVAAGLKVIAVANTFFPLDPSTSSLASRTLDSIGNLTPEVVGSVLRS